MKVSETFAESAFARHPRQKAKTAKTDRRRLSSAGQVFEDVGRKMGEALLPPDMAFGQTGGVRQFLECGVLTGGHG